MTSTKRGTQCLCIVLLLLSCCALSAENEQPRVRNIVLVHGAWADGSGWKGVYDILVKDGYTSASFRNRRPPLKKMSLLRSGSLLNKMDRAFWWLTAMGEQ